MLYRIQRKAPKGASPKPIYTHRLETVKDMVLLYIRLGQWKSITIDTLTEKQAIKLGYSYEADELPTLTFATKRGK